jgi:hypothetical protein
MESLKDVKQGHRVELKNGGHFKVEHEKVRIAHAFEKHLGAKIQGIRYMPYMPLTEDVPADIENILAFIKQVLEDEGTVIVLEPGV